MKIGVFDSGIGGITVLNALRRRVTGVDFVYLGDTAHVPYGTKSPAQIRRLCVESATVLKSKKIDALVVACNTASSLALGEIRAVMESVPVFGMVEPGVEAVTESHGGSSLGPVLVLATRATVRSGAYGIQLRDRFSQNGWQTEVFEQECPLLVPMIEEGWVDHAILHQTIGEYVHAHRSSQPPGVALLGCTHYPWIQAAFERALPGWKVVNSAEAVVSHLGKVGLIQPTPVGLSRLQGAVDWIFSDPDAVPAFAKELVQG